MTFGIIIAAFIAGLFMFLAPCTLPLVPAYIGFISGVALKDLQDPEKLKQARKKVIYNSLFYIAGFSIVFIFFGVLAGFGGTALAKHRLWLPRVGGIFIIFFGLYMMRIFDFKFLSFLKKEKRLKIPKSLKPGSALSSLIFGATFAFGWTPCIGPILGSIIFLASSSTTVWHGAFLLAVFSLGLAIPYFLIALTLGWSTKYLNKINKFLPGISFIGGLFLLFLGILLVTDSFGIWATYGDKFFLWLGLKPFFDYL